MKLAAAARLPMAVASRDVLECKNRFARPSVQHETQVWRFILAFVWSVRMAPRAPGTEMLGSACFRMAYAGAKEWPQAAEPLRII